LRREDYVHGEVLGSHTGLPDIQWLHPRGTLMGDEDWHAAQASALGVLLSVPDPRRDPPEDVVLLLFNAGRDERTFTLPVDEGLQRYFDGWQVLLSTADDPAIEEDEVRVAARSVCVLAPAVRRSQ
jgi:glycogen operon protein